MGPLAVIEKATKGPVFGCKMCGQCVLHSTGLTCPMTCPKTLRNGPCGGVRADGTCEVKPEMQCVWLKAYERSGFRQGSFPVSEQAAAHVLSLPMFPELLPEQQRAVAKAVQRHIG